MTFSFRNFNIADRLNLFPINRFYFVKWEIESNFKRKHSVSYIFINCWNRFSRKRVKMILRLTSSSIAIFRLCSFPCTIWHEFLFFYRLKTNRKFIPSHVCLSVALSGCVGDWKTSFRHFPSCNLYLFTDLFKFYFCPNLVHRTDTAVSSILVSIRCTEKW